jgi:hypothetical protein
MQAVGVRRAVHRAAEVRLDVRWDVWWGQACGASGCGQQGQESGALGGGGLAGGASGCTWRVSGLRCLGMQSVGLGGAVQWEAGFRLEEHRAVGVFWEVLWDAHGEGQVGGASGCGLLGQARCALGLGSGGRCFGMLLVEVRWEVLRDAGSGNQVSSAGGGGVRL